MDKEQPVSTRGITRDDSALLFIETDLNGVITYANDALIKITGYHRDELIVENISLIHHPDTPQWLVDDINTTIKGGHPWQGILKNRTKLDEIYWVHAIVTPIMRAGQITGSLSLWKTPSKNKIAEAEILYRTGLPPDTSFSIRRWFSQLRLQTKLQVLIQSAILFTGMLATFGLYGQMKAAMLENARHRAEATAMEVIDSANMLMVTGEISDPANRKLMIEKIMEGQKLLSLKLVRTEQVVRQFGPGLPEEHLDDPQIELAIENSVKQGKPVPSFSLEDAQGRPVFRAITPYIESHNFHETDCLACHDVEVGSSNGASDIMIDLSAEFNRLHTTIMLLIAGLAILQVFLFFFIGGVIHRFVSRPAEKLKKHLHRITNGDYTKSLDISGRDEMGELACSVQTTKLLLGSTVDLVSIKLTETLHAKNELEQQSLVLFHTNEQLTALIEAIPDSIFLKDGEERWLLTNEPARQLFNLHKIPWQGKNGMELAKLHPEFRAMHEGFIVSDERAWQAGRLIVDEETLIGAAGEGSILEMRKMPVFGDEGQRKGLVVIARDITERKAAEQELTIAAAAFESKEAMMITNANGMILRVNSAFIDITGYSDEEIIGQNPNILKSGRQDNAFYVAMWERIHRTGGWEGEIWNRRKNGEIYPEHLTISSVKDRNGCVTNYVSTFTDITDRKSAEEKIMNLAFFDPLTHLPNRRLLLDRIQQALVSRTRSGMLGALLFIDLDNFKIINDTLGHEIGDLLLKQVAERLQSCVREEDTVARLGGDEFVVMLEDLSKNYNAATTQTESVANKLLFVLNQTYQINEHACRSSASIGITLFKDATTDMDTLLRQADIAMYQSKKAGRDTLRFFDQTMQDTINLRASLEAELRKAFVDEQFQLYYQIQMDSSCQPLGAEALIRWIHPERGMISPADFIPLAEETGMILPLGHWVLTTACEQLATWSTFTATSHLTIAVNISAMQFKLPTFVEEVISLIEFYQIDPSKLKLEITESTLLDNVDEIVVKMNKLQKLGINFSMDDFGTGYSSLQYLKRLPIDQLKIDQSFVRDITLDSSDLAIVRTIIAMAHSLNMDVIAEGVEIEEQRQLLLNNGCAHFQGYLFSKPVPIDQFEMQLKNYPI